MMFDLCHYHHLLVEHHQALEYCQVVHHHIVFRLLFAHIGVEEAWRKFDGALVLQETIDRCGKPDTLLGIGFILTSMDTNNALDAVDMVVVVIVEAPAIFEEDMARPLHGF